MSGLGLPPGFTPRIVLWLQGPSTVRPSDHEPWCAECTGKGYPENDCTCDLEERQAQWDRENRSPNAAELPRAVIVKTKWDRP